MLTFRKDGARIIREHFQNLTPEQFKRDLERCCPEILEEYEVIGLKANTLKKEGGNDGQTVEAS